MDVVICALYNSAVRAVVMSVVNVNVIIVTLDHDVGLITSGVRRTVANPDRTNLQKRVKRVKGPRLREILSIRIITLEIGRTIVISCRLMDRGGRGSDGIPPPRRPLAGPRERGSALAADASWPCALGE